MSTSKQSRALRKKGKTSESVNPSLDNHTKLAYNILKNLEDDILGEKEIPELDKCLECNNEILASPPKAITILSCGHTFHRICIEKKLLLTMPNTCPFPDCGKNVDIIEPFPNTNEESPILALSNRMNESLAILSSPILQMEGVKNTGSQPVKGYLRCAKCSEDLSSSLPPVSSIRFPLQPQEPPKPLVYLTCKHIVHYACIDNPRKLCPICPSTDMEIDNLETPTEQNSSTAQKKRSSEFASEKDSNKKAKKTKKPVDRDQSPTLQRLIRELTTTDPGDEEILQTEPASESNNDSNIFLNLYNKIVAGEDQLKKTTQDVLRHYFDFGEAMKKRYDHYRLNNEDLASQSLVEDDMQKQLPNISEEALRKRIERAQKVYGLFSSINVDIGGL